MPKPLSFTMSKTISLKIKGRVQGVGFRYHTLQKANEYSIMGFVKNEYDGSVYIEAEGKEENLNNFAFWCKKGPGYSRVTEVLISEIPRQNFNVFVIKH